MSLIAVDYECPKCGTFDELVERPAPDTYPCPTCGADARWVPSPVFGHVNHVTVTRGTSTKAERSTWTDTSALGEGQSMTEWRKERAKVWEAKRKERVWKQTHE